MKGNIAYFDMHTHSNNSHDSKCEIFEMAQAAAERGISGFAVTDHCDIGYCETLDVKGIIRGSFEDATTMREQTDLMVLRGIEIGEATWNMSVAGDILQSFDFDVVIGSVHAVKFKGLDMPYAQIDFAKTGKETTQKFLEQYFDDLMEMLEKCDFDILAHVTCPLRYINGKYEMGIDCRKYEGKIERILERVIKRKIALEVNTSCMYDGSKYCVPMPERWIIQKYKDMGGRLVTLGSDAHAAENSANRFDAAYDMLKEIGLADVYYYEKRRAVKCAVI